MTQGELARAAGLKQPDISKMERGQIVKTTGMARLAAALKVPARWLELGMGDEPNWDAAPSLDDKQAAPTAWPFKRLSQADWDRLRTADLASAVEYAAVKVARELLQELDASESASRKRVSNGH